MEINPILNSLKEFSERTLALRTYLDYDGKRERLEEVERELEDPNVWIIRTTPSSWARSAPDWRTWSRPSMNWKAYQ